MKKRVVLVTGAAGFIAYHVIEALLRRGIHVVGIDNFDPFYGRKIKETNVRELKQLAMKTVASFHFEELAVQDLTERHFQGMDFEGIIHLAAKPGVRPSVREPESYFNANVYGTFKVLEFVRHRNIAKVVFASSSSIYGNGAPVPFRENEPRPSPVSPYGMTKLMGEELCQGFSTTYGLKTVCLRLFTVYGPRQRPDLAIHKFTRSILEAQEIILYGDGSTSRDYTYVSDTRDGILAALDWLDSQRPGTCEVFNLGASDTIPLTGLIELLERRLRTSAIKTWVPLPLSEMVKTYADLEKSRRMLGYSPQVRIQDGIRLFTDWYLGRETVVDSIDWAKPQPVLREAA